MQKGSDRGFDWAGLPVIATVALLLCRELTLQNEYLRPENQVLKQKVQGRLRFTDEERRSLVEAALAMGRSLMKEVVRSVTGECLDHLVLLGMSSLQRALRVCRGLFNGHRPHQEIGNRIPERRSAGEMSRDHAGLIRDGFLAVECRQFLGGLLDLYCRKAA
jgi:hypothetical protein